jgi:glycine dehydrogenase subunit 1
MFIPHTDEDREAMLEAVGVSSMAELFEAVPAQHRFPAIELDPALTEMEAMAEMKAIASINEGAQELVCFLGAGAYNHYVPAAVDMMLRRGEFYTAYTPYQPEISQGTLQAIFDYQSLITSLTGMDVSNASHYDGATAVAEAVSLAYANFRGKRTKIVMSPGVHPHSRQVVHTYNQSTPMQVVGEDVNLEAGPDALLKYVDNETALVIVQYPDFFGRVYDLKPLANEVHAHGALLCVAVNPMALAILTPPGEMGADVVTGEGQPLGIPLSFGGPYLGIFATKQEFVRKMAGRLVGETVDNRGQRAYVLTLTAREQHIRREKATSNICTNQGLMALAATVYMSVVGQKGLIEVAELCYHKAHYLADSISALPNYSLWSGEAFFNEFVVRCPQPASEVLEHLLEHDILGGYDLGKDYPEMEDCLLIAVTEMNSRDEIDLLVEILSEVNHD